MNEFSPIQTTKYKLTDDAISAVKELVRTEVQRLLNTICLDEVVYKEYQKTLDKYMMKQYPDLSNRVNQMSLDLKDSVNNIEKKLKDLIFREKNIAKSESLYEDVYKIRDEFKIMKETLEKLSKNIKKAFDI